MQIDLNIDADAFQRLLDKRASAVPVEQLTDRRRSIYDLSKLNVGAWYAIHNDDIYIRLVSDADNPNLWISIFRRVPHYWFKGRLEANGEGCVLHGEMMEDKATRFSHRAAGVVTFLFFAAMSLIVYFGPLGGLGGAAVPLVIWGAGNFYINRSMAREKKMEEGHMRNFLEGIAGNGR